MNKLLTAVLAASVYFAPAAIAQELPTPAGAAATADTPSAPAGNAPTGAANEPTASAPQSPGPGAAPDTGTGGLAPPTSADAEGQHATPHYPLEHPHKMDWTFA